MKETADKKTTIKDLLFDDHNANKGTSRGRAALERSLSKYGAGRSILLDKDNRIVAGNKTIQCAGEIGMEKVRIIETDGTEIIAVKRTDLSLGDKQARGLALADNRVAQLDLDWSAEELSQMAIDGITEDLFFTQDEIDRIVSKELDAAASDLEVNDADAKIENKDELAQKYGIQIGQVWELGTHKIICGDCSDESILGKLFGEERADIVFTDPPYGVSIGKKNVMLNSFQKAGRNLTSIIDDDIKPEDLKIKLVKAFTNAKKFLKDKCSIFVTAPQGGELGMMMMMQESCLPIRHVIMWLKNSPTFSMGRLDYEYKHEPILYTWNKSHEFYGNGQFKCSVWEFDKPRKCNVHPTMKPPELYVNALLNNSQRGDIALDMYSGSGTMIVACESVGRCARVSEIDPGYVAVAIDRWETITGEKAVAL